MITSEANSHGAPDAAVATISDSLANAHTWTFDFDNTVNSGVLIDSAQIYITHQQTGWIDDSLVLEYFDGTSFTAFESFANVPGTLTTTGPYSASNLSSTSQLDGFQVRLRGVQQGGGVWDSVTYAVDAIELRVYYPLNSPPVLAPIGARSVDEGQNLNFGVSASDPDGDSLLLSAVNVPANATYTDNFNGTGTFDFNADYAQAGVHNVTFVVSDGALADTEIVAITVNNINRAPAQAVIGAQSVNEGQNLNFGVSATDPDSDSLILSAVNVPTNATFTDNYDGTGSFDFNPDFTQSGVYNVTFISSDGSLADTEVVAITVNQVNIAPVLAAIGAQSVDEGQNLNFGVSASDFDGDSLILSAVNVPANGTFTDDFNGTGSFDFNPDFAQAGVYNVTFVVSDGALADTEIVAITVNNVNRAPVQAAIGAQSVNEGQNLNFGVSASDPDSDSLILSAVNVPTNATFTDNYDGTGLFDFNPDFTQSDVYNVTFISSDGSLADTEVVAITVNNVNRAPVQAAIGAQSVNEGQNLNFGVSATDPDADSLILSAENVPANATFTDNYDGTGSFDFNPDFTQSSVYNVTFISSDGALADTEIVALTVNHVNVAPVLATIGSQSVNEGLNLNLGVSASDFDGDSLILSAVNVPANATFTDNYDGTGTFDFNPDFTESGAYNVTFIASDGSLADTEIVAITVSNVNQAPVLAAIGAQSVAENQNLNFGVSASDFDLDSLILSAENVPANATFTDNYDGTGSFDFNPDFSQAGVYNVTFIASDGSLADTEIVVITVSNVNRAPVQTAIGSQSVDEGQNLSFGVTASDPDGDSLILSAENVPTNAIFTDNYDGTGSFDFNPDFSQSGAYNVTFISSDGDFADTEIVAITVNQVNVAPALAAIGAQSVDEGQNLNFGVSASDFDLDSLILSAENVPANATFTDNYDGTGSFDFNPDFTQSGVYNVTFIASDGVLADTEIVAITANQFNLAPVLASIGAQSVDEGQNLNFGVSASDFDLDSLILSAENVPLNATFTDNYDGTGAFNFNPDFAQSGVYNVRFIVSDGALADTEIVAITVNQVNVAPALAAIGAQSVDEGQNLNFGVSATDPDADSLILSAENIPANATFTDNYDGTGTFDFNPDFTESGVYNVTFIASDGSLADTEIVAITVSDVNQAPVLATIGAQSVDEGQNLNFGVSSSDFDLDSLILSAENVPANATFTDNYDGTGSFDFNPDFSQAGVYNVTFIASDGSLADTEIVAITVNQFNLAPTLAAIGAQSVAENQNLNFGVSASDFDLDSLILSAVDVPANATFTDNYDGTGSFDFNPDFTQSDVYNVTFISSDGALADTEIVAITVNQVNVAPALAAIGAQSVDEGQNLNFGVSASDFDLDSLILSAENIPANATFTDNYDGTGSFDFNPDFTQSGVYNVNFIASDGVLADTEIVAITANQFNLAPVLASIGARSVDEGQNLNFGVSATDPDADSLILSAENVPANATFTDNYDGTGAFNFNPDFAQSGVYNVRFIVSDGALADTEIVAITVNQVNLAPVLTAIGAQSVDEGQNLNLGVSATDFDGDSLIFSALNVPVGATFTDNFNTTGTFDFNPDFTQSGAYNVTFIVSDGALADTEIVAITVNQVNIAPVLAAIGAQSVNENQNLNFGVSASDFDNDSLILSAVNVPANATFTDNFNGTGTFDFTPDFFQAGVYNVSFIASDGALADTEIVTITVGNVNRVPAIASVGPKTVDEGQNLNFTVTASDPDGDSLIMSAVNIPTNATYTDNFNNTGTFDFHPNFNQAGPYFLILIASDGASADTEIVSITVNQVNVAPVLATIGSKSVTEGQNLNFGMSATDLDGDSIIFSAVNVPANATFTDNFNGTGSFDFNPDFTQQGVYNVSFIASDGALADTEIVAITVNQFNLPPVLAAIGAQSVDENQNLNFGVSASDPDADSLILSAENAPVNATFTDNFNGTGTFDFNPDFTQSGVYNVRFIVSDGVLADTELVAITVNQVNLAPVLAVIGAQSVAENANLNFGVSASDFDNDSLILSAENMPINAVFTDNYDGTGTFDFNPAFTQAGVYNVRFIVSDGALADSEIVTITVTDTPRAPVLAAIGAQSVEEGQNLNLGITASDPDGDSLILSALDVPVNATFTDNFDGTGTFDFNPDYTQSGVYNVTFIAADGALADTEIVAITVNHVNLAPVLAAIGPQSVTEGFNLNFGVSASDFDGDSLILSVANAPANATLTDNFNGTGTFDFNPNYIQSGVYNVSFIASDGALADTEIVAITVNEAGNQTPTLDPIGTLSVTEGDTLSIRIHATDLEFATLTLFTSLLPTNAAFVDSGNGAGSFTFTPSYTQSGIYYVTFAVQDPPGAIDNELVQINVLDAGDQAPVLAPIGPQAVAEGAHLAFRISATDVDLDSLILSAVDVPLNATFVDSANGAGSFVFDPDYGQAGIFNVTFIASDGTLADSEVVVISVGDVNLPPVLAAIGPQSADENQNLNVGVSATDPDADSLILSAENVPANATFTDNFDGTGTFDFNPDFAQAGVYDVTFIVSDGALADTEIVTVTVNNVDRAPVLAAIGARSVDEGQNLNFGVSASDPDVDSLILTAENLPANATFNDQYDGTGIFDFNPDFSQSGVYNLTFIASDGTLADTEIVAITVNHVNLTPVLAPIGAQSVDEGQNLNFGVFASDFDLDSLILTAENIPVNAAFTDNFDGTGSFDFNPDYVQSGVYDVTFIVSDGALADTEIVAISVNDAGNQRPALDAIGAQSVTEGQNLNFGVSSSDPDGDSLILSALNMPVNATFTDNFDGTGTFDFNPSYVQAGVYNVSFIASDGALADTETVAITVNEAGNQRPVLASIGAQIVDEGQSLNFNTSGTDPDGDSLVFSAVDVPANATFADNFDGTGTLDFNPDFTQAGVYNVTVIVSDGALADTEIVAITVNDAGNQRPVLAAIGAQSVDEGQNLNFGLTATDADLDSLILSAENVPANASFTDNYDGTGTFDFSPDFLQSGVYNVTLIASDGSLADTEIVAITVNHVNIAPVLAAIGAQSVDEGQNLNFGVSASDFDTDSLILTAEDVPGNATFTDNYDGTGTFDFNPDFTQSGVYDVRFIVRDGALADTEIVAITVNHVNLAPVLAAIGGQSVAEGQNLNLGVSASDFDGDSLILSAQNIPLNATFNDNFDGTGAFDFNPDFTQAGVYNVTFIVSDGVLADTEVVAISVGQSNLPPVLASIGAQSVDEGQNMAFGTSATDPDGDSLIMTAVDIPANATYTDNFDGTGAFDFNPDFTQSGVYNVTFIVSDGFLADTEIVAITVNHVNIAPVLASIGSQSVDEGQNLNFGVSASDFDLDSLILSTENVPANATFTDNYDGTGTFDFNPDYTQSGVYNVRFIVSDGALADTEIVAITVNHVNIAPVLAAIGAQSVDEGQNLNFGVSASDFDLDSLILSAENVPANATFTDNFDGTGTFDFNPDFTQSGAYNVRFIVSDGTLADTEIVAITVNHVNLTPVLATIGSQSVDEGLNLNFGVSASDFDGDALILSAENTPANANFTDFGDGTGNFDFNPDFLQAGIYAVRFIVSDGALADTENVTITVNDANAPPILDPIGAKSVAEGSHLEFRVFASDVDGTTPGLSAVDVPLHAAFADSGNGAGGFVFDPDYTQEGIYNVTFIASDGTLADTEIVAITVTGENATPVAAAGPDQGPVALGTLIQLDGSGSSDADLDPLGYHWRLVSGPSMTFSDSNVVNPTFTVETGGIYTIELLVDDGTVYSAPSTMTVTAVSQPSAITDLNAAVAGAAIQLTWTPVTTDTSGAATTLSRYVIYRGTRAYFTPTDAESIGVASPGFAIFADNNLVGADVVGDTGVNYFYCVVAVDVAGARSEISNRVGEYDFQIYTTSTTDFSLITVPFAATGISTASDLIQAIGTANVNTVSRYIAASQSYESRFAAGFGINFTIVPGGVYQVNAKSPTVFTTAGRIPEPGTVSYAIVTTSTTDFSFISIPFEDELNYQVAQDVINALPGVLNTLSRFIPPSQSYESRFAAGFGVNFPVRPGRAYQANAAASTTFPGP